MLMNKDHHKIFAIAFCEICREYMIFINESTYRLDAERKISKHAETKHGYNKNRMRWTDVEREMAEISRKSGFKEGYL